MPREPYTAQQRWPTRRKLAAATLIVAVIAGAALVFLPIGWQINRFIVRLYFWFLESLGWSPLSIEQWAVALNVLLFLVPASLFAVVWPRVSWWVWAALGCAASAAVEVVQYLFLPRQASLLDWVANGSGALVGALIVTIFSSSSSKDLAPESEGSG